jgi:hypothetical protein
MAHVAKTSKGRSRHFNDGFHPTKAVGVGAGK